MRGCRFAAVSPQLLPLTAAGPGQGLARAAPLTDPGPSGLPARGARRCRANTAPWRRGAAGPGQPLPAEQPLRPDSGGRFPRPAPAAAPAQVPRGPGCRASTGGGEEQPSGKGHSLAARPRAVVRHEALLREWCCPSQFFRWYLVTMRLSTWAPRGRQGKGECIKGKSIGKRKAGRTDEK